MNVSFPIMIHVYTPLGGRIRVPLPKRSAFSFNESFLPNFSLDLKVNSAASAFPAARSEVSVRMPKGIAP
jgi:hypothetical protein